MKSTEIKELFVRFEGAANELEGVECWSARELQGLLGYSKWENFKKVIDKAKEACRNVGENVDDHFPDVRKAIVGGKGDQALFRLSTLQMKRKWNIPDKRPIADFLPTVSIKAKDLAAEMTSVNVQ